MRRLILSDTALADLDGILRFIASEGGDYEAARRFVDGLAEKCAKLASLPGTLGRPRPELRPDIRSFPVKGYIIFFRYREDAVEVVNVLAGLRDIEGYFAKDSDR
ncbi:MAG: type II toxin-antitoxin system RelE/ParE family toxin [Elsteraceae bacterium]